MTSRERYGGGKIVVCDYDPTWPAMFEKERTRLQAALGSLALTIEHAGSTAVPGLAAKSIIDLLVGVHSLTAARPRCIEPLRALGYAYIAEAEPWLPNEMLFRKGMPGPWTHHVHVMEPTSPRWEEFIVIRDYLRRQSEVADAYAALKRGLALVFGDDIGGYRTAKRPFLRAVMSNAQTAEKAGGRG
jgi:GrpB-like predicted nucleotidyltransferase (UPF0157 family)